MIADLDQYIFQDLLDRFERKTQIEIVDFIVDFYHQRLREQFQKAIDLSEKVERVHRMHSDCPKGLHDFLKIFAEDLNEHMLKEEEILFPLIKNGQGHHAYMPIKVMQEEHDAHQNSLNQLRDFTQNYKIPSGACRSWEKLYELLTELDEELNEHIILENQILFVRALRP